MEHFYTTLNIKLGALGTYHSNGILKAKEAEGNNKDLPFKMA